MKELKGKYYLIDVEGNVLRFGRNGEMEYGYCTHRGNIVLFDRREEASLVRNTFDSPESWSIVEI